VQGFLQISVEPLTEITCSKQVLSLFAVVLGLNAFVATADTTGFIAAAAKASTTATANRSR
jgi:hypothetical protein